MNVCDVCGAFTKRRMAIGGRTVCSSCVKTRSAIELVTRDDSIRQLFQRLLAK